MQCSVFFACFILTYSNDHHKITGKSPIENPKHKWYNDSTISERMGVYEKNSAIVSLCYFL